MRLPSMIHFTAILVDTPEKTIDAVGYSLMLSVSFP